MSLPRSKIYSTNGLRGIQAKRSVPSYKDKRKMKRDPSGHIRFEHTHEPIIDMQTWETVQKLRQGKRRPTSIGETSKYSGLLFRADCGSKLYFNHKRADDPKNCSFNCSHYRNNAKDKCTPHRICEVVPDELLLEELRRITYTARKRERQIAEFINKKAPRKTDGSLTPSSVNMKDCLKERRSLMHCSSDCMRTMSSAG